MTSRLNLPHEAEKNEKIERKENVKKRICLEEPVTVGLPVESFLYLLFTNKVA